MTNSPPCWQHEQIHTNKADAFALENKPRASKIKPDARKNKLGTSKNKPAASKNSQMHVST